MGDWSVFPSIAWFEHPWSRASVIRQFLLSQWASQFLFLFLISSSIILPSSTLSSTTAFFILSVHFARFVLFHTHISNDSSRFCSFSHSVQVSAHATLHYTQSTSLFSSVVLFPRARRKTFINNLQNVSPYYKHIEMDENYEWYLAVYFTGLVMTNTALH